MTVNLVVNHKEGGLHGSSNTPRLTPYVPRTRGAVATPMWLLLLLSFSFFASTVVGFPVTDNPVSQAESGFDRFFKGPSLRFRTPK